MSHHPRGELLRDICSADARQVKCHDAEIDLVRLFRDPLLIHQRIHANGPAEGLYRPAVMLPQLALEVSEEGRGSLPRRDGLYLGEGKRILEPSLVVEAFVPSPEDRREAIADGSPSDISHPMRVHWVMSALLGGLCLIAVFALA